MNKQLKGTISLLLMVGILTILSSCKTSKTLVTRAELKKKSFSDLYRKMEQKQAQYRFFSAKLNLNYQKDGSAATALKGQLRIRKDSMIWLSIIPGMGIELARTQVTPDSLKLINRLHKNYFVGNYRLLDSLLHTSLDYDVVQSLILGNDITGYQIQSSNAGVDGGDYVLNIKRRKMIRKNPLPNMGETSQLVQKIWLNPDNYRLRKVDIVEKVKNHKENRVQVFYDEYQLVEGQLFPQKIRVLFFSHPKTEISITFKQIQINRVFGFPFVIPKSYKKLM